MLHQGQETPSPVVAMTPVKPRTRTPTAKKATAVKVSKTAEPEQAAAVTAPPQDVTREDIAKLAYMLWASRGYTGGSPDGDWLSAEAYLRELKTKA